MNGYFCPLAHSSYDMEHAISTRSLVNPNQGCSHCPCKILEFICVVLLIIKVKILVLIINDHLEPPLIRLGIRDTQV